MSDTRAESPGLDDPSDLPATVAFLREALAGPLPGLEAHLVMAPKPRVGWRPAAIPGDARAAAALVLLYPGNDGSSAVVLTVRAPDLVHHGGQVSLPGGAVEPGESIEGAALRESAEEVGLDSREVALLGRLSPLHIPVSGFVLHPVVGTLAAPPAFHRGWPAAARCCCSTWPASSARRPSPPNDRIAHQTRPPPARRTATLRFDRLAWIPTDRSPPKCFASKTAIFSGVFAELR